MEKICCICHRIVKKNVNLKIKALMTFPIRIFNSPRWAKRLILKFGNPICCPSVCLNTDKVGNKPYISKDMPNVANGDFVAPGTVLFGSLAVYKGTDDVDPTEVPGIKVMTDAGQLTALNDDEMEPVKVSGMYLLPLTGNAVSVHAYRDVCVANMQNSLCPYIQVGDYDMVTGEIKVNPYKFITQRLRRGRAVTVRLIANGLDYLAAALRCIRKSSCASGIVNVYVAAKTDASDGDTLTTSVFSADAGMMAVAAVETLTIQGECAEARVIL